ncbi:MAG: fibronectin type III domain-containing protein, partial [Limisphaerales bacterium]
YELGADGFVFDAEEEWESGKQGTNGPAKAMSMLSQVKTNYPTKFLAHSPFPYITYHSSFPYKEFGYWCDAIMPQCYWYSIGVTPQKMVDDMDSQWRNWQNSLTGQWTNSIKPIAPIGQADDPNIPASEITAFVNAVKNSANPATSGGYQSVSWWRSDLHTAAHWDAIGTNNIGGAMGTVHPIIIDNISATFAGTWTTATSASDKYFTDYRYKGSGTGTAHAQFRPSIWTSGSYQISEWHSQGGNRSAGTPHLIKHATGSNTINVNQQINGGKWNVLGTYNLTADTGGSYVRIRDDFTDTANIAMADAIRFVYVTPSAPAAPSGLTANVVSSRQINLTWNDNSSNEEWFEIRRSTTSGGPYTNILVSAANVGSFADRTVLPGTTYYYVIRSANAGGVSASTAQASATTYPEIIVDNPDATVVGSWSSATSAADKYGADYRFKSSGSGAAYLQFTPNITIAGDYQVYEWHPQGSNRTTNAPYVITYNGGSTTVGVNQKVNGAKWNLLGTFTFATGTSGNVRIQDNFPDTGQIVMADAIRFVLVGALTPPNAPSGLSASAISSSQINLSWSDNSNNEDNFIVSRSTTSGGPYTDIATLPANSTSFSNTGLNGGTTYYYVVRAVNSGASSANSAQASATTQLNPPAAPSGLTATAVSSSQIDLSWTDNSNNESNFIVARSTTSGGPYTDIATLGANVTSYSNTGLNPVTTYYYVVRASNSGGTSANSAQASATTQQIPAPSAPSSLVASTVSQTQINLSWTDNSSNESNFVIARSTTSGG